MNLIRTDIRHEEIIIRKENVSFLTAPSVRELLKLRRGTQYYFAEEI